MDAWSSYCNKNRIYYFLKIPLSLAKTTMLEVKSKITDSCDKMKLFEKKRVGKTDKKQIQNIEYNKNNI